MADKQQALTLLRARAQTIRDACATHKVEPDNLTAAAFLYNAMKLLKMPADHIFDGPLALALQAIATSLESAAEGQRPPRADDPNAEITLTQAQLLQLLSSKVGNA
jgi:hypothetical protein